MRELWGRRLRTEGRPRLRLARTARAATSPVHGAIARCICSTCQNSFSGAEMRSGRRCFSLAHSLDRTRSETSGSLTGDARRRAVRVPEHFVSRAHARESASPTRRPPGDAGFETHRVRTGVLLGDIDALPRGDGDRVPGDRTPGTAPETPWRPRGGRAASGRRGEPGMVPGLRARIAVRRESTVCFLSWMRWTRVSRSWRVRGRGDGRRAVERAAGDLRGHLDRLPAGHRRGRRGREDPAVVMSGVDGAISPPFVYIPKVRGNEERLFTRFLMEFRRNHAQS